MARPRILITRSPHQASGLAEALRALGAEPILIPTVEFANPTNFGQLDAALNQLETYHWLLFTSANAVEAFHARQKTLCNQQHIAAIGPATARALEAAGLRVDLQPAQAVAESMAEALLPFALQPDGSATRFLLIRAEQARDVLPESLRAAGADVTIAPAYRTVIPQASLGEIQRLFASPDRYPDAVTFTSSSTASNLLSLLEVAKLRLPSEVLRISIGPVTSQTLCENKIPPHREASEPTIAALAQAVWDELRVRGRRK